MKAIITLATIFAVSVNLFGQQYESFFGTNNTVTSIAQEAIDAIINYSVEINPLNTKIINGKEYIDLKTGAYLRQNLNNDKLYYLQEGTSNKEFLIADLSLTVGDTFNISRPTGDSIAVVTNVITENGRKKIITDFEINFDTITYNLSFIEGVGTNAGYFFPLNFSDPFSAGNSILLCTQKDDEYVYLNSELNGDCNYQSNVGINTTTLNHSKIIYNRSNSVLNINLSSENSGLIYISNMKGNCLKYYSFKNLSHLKIETKNLQKGCYILNILTEQQNISSKFIKI